MHMKINLCIHANMYVYVRTHLCMHICGGKRTTHLKLVFAKAAATFHHARLLQILQSRGQQPQDLRFPLSKELSCDPARKKQPMAYLKQKVPKYCLKFHMTPSERPIAMASEESLLPLTWPIVCCVSKVILRGEGLQYIIWNSFDMREFADCTIIWKHPNTELIIAIWQWLMSCPERNCTLPPMIFSIWQYLVDIDSRTDIFSSRGHCSSL